MASVGSSEGYFYLTALQPYKFAPDNNAGDSHTNVKTFCPYDAGGLEGWGNEIYYTAEDQLSNPIKGAPYSEYWELSGDQYGTPSSSSPTSYGLDYNGSFNWSFLAPGNATTDGSTGDVFDAISVLGSGATVPQVNAETNCGSGTSIDHWNQQWWVGSSTPGHGVHVQDDLLHRYLAKGLHENVHSPIGS